MDFNEIVVSDFEILEKENLLSGTDLKVIAKQRAHFEEKLQLSLIHISEPTRPY